MDEFSAEGDDGRTDGRTARRNRNRDAVLDAVIELFAEDSLAPAATEVAERSGVSLRSVYRYFEDMEGLARAAIAHNMAKVQPLFVIDGLGEGPLDQRIDRMVDGRVRLFERVAPVMRATMLRSGSNEILREQLDNNRRALRTQVEAMFEPELRAMAAVARREVAASLDVLLGFESIDHLRQTRGFSGSETSRILGRAMTSLLR